MCMPESLVWNIFTQDITVTKKEKNPIKTRKYLLLEQVPFFGRSLLMAYKKKYFSSDPLLKYTYTIGAG